MLTKVKPYLYSIGATLSERREKSISEVSPYQKKLELAPMVKHHKENGSSISFLTQSNPALVPTHPLVEEPEVISKSLRTIDLGAVKKIQTTKKLD
jgi:hypothetical protein